MSGVRRYCTRAVIAVSLVLLVSFAAAPAAHAGVITSWYGIQPTGTAGTGVPIMISGGATADGYLMDATTIKLYIDGVLYPRSRYYASSRNGTGLYLSCSPSPALADGAHVFRVEISDVAGKLSAYQWGATIAQAPSASFTAPAQGVTIYSGTPRIALSLSDNTPGSLASVAGQVRSGSATGPVVATFGGAGLPQGSAAFTPSSELAPGTYYLTATVTDAAGLSTALSGTSARRFATALAPAMSIPPADCLASGCHVKTGHPATGMPCASCHVAGYHESNDCSTDNCHGPHPGPVTVTGVIGSCTSCHSASYPSVARHSEASVTATHTSSCEGCHIESLTTRHATIAGSAYAGQCDLCHASTDPLVRAAIAEHSVSCSACHPGAGHASFHTGTRTSCALSGCHDAGAMVVHPTCDTCHALATLPAGTECMNCHTSTTEPHVTFASRHVGDTTGGTVGGVIVSGCRFDSSYEGYCHDVSNTMRLHANVHNSSDGCPECHGPGRSLTNKCVTCHSQDDRVFVHHSNNKYLAVASDAAPGSYATASPANGWNSLADYDCQWCHWSYFYATRPTLPEQRSPYSGDGMWYGGLRASGYFPADTQLRLPGTYAVTADTRLEYRVNYQTQLTYDYGYSEVTTDGATWMTVPGNITSVEPISARHLGNGIHGDSGTWTDASFDLSAYAGQTVQIRLRYKTTWDPQAFGYAVDDIVLREGANVLFSNDGESSGGLISSGWERVGVYPPKYYPDDPNNAP